MFYTFLSFIQYMELKTINKLIFDESCILCRNKELVNEISILCNDCLNNFKKNTENICEVCGHPKDKSEKCISCSHINKKYFDNYKFIKHYEESDKKIINKLKMNGYFIIYKIFLFLIIKNRFILKDGIVTVVPDNIFDRSKKGRSGLKYFLKLLERKGYKTKYNIYLKKELVRKKQKNKNINERYNDIHNIFYLPKKNINKFKGKIYLIDDIFTSGATLNYGAKLLKIAGFEVVNIISFYRAKINNK